MANLREEIELLQSQLQQQKADQSVLMDELAAQSGEIETLCRTNGAVVEALNRVWDILDRLTGRRPDPIQVSHIHTFRPVREATFVYGDVTLGFGTTEACACGVVRSRLTKGSALQEYEG